MSVRSAGSSAAPESIRQGNMTRTKEEAGDMEVARSTPVYKDFGKIYDDIYLPLVDYAADAEFLNSLFGMYWQYKRPPRAVLDVGCGTGTHAIELARKYDYSVTGIDVSTVMLSRANAKRAGRVKPKTKFLNQNMCSFKLDRSFDAAICMLNSFGYATENGQPEQTMRSVRSHLAREGLFVVEFWQRDVIVPQRIHRLAVPDHAGIWRRNVRRFMRIRPLNGVVEIFFEFQVFGARFFTDFGPARFFFPKEFAEVHRLRVYSLDEFRDLARECGFDVLALMHRGYLEELVRTYDEPTPESVRILAVLRKR